MSMEEVKVYDWKQQSGVDFDKYRIDLSKDVPEPAPLIVIGDKPLFTRGNISCIAGKAKSRKTFLICLLSGQFLESTDNLKVVIFDTEQAIFHVQKATKRIHRLLDWEDNRNDDRLRVFSLRELDTEKRREFVKSAIEHFRPDMAFVDGARDLLHDFNNISESTEIVNLLMNLSSVYNCHICCVLHENKADNNVRGHAGTELQNKAESVISVEADGEVSAVSPKYCRNIPFEKFYCRIDENGLPGYCDPEMKPKNNDKLKSLFEELLPGFYSLAFADLRTKVMDKTGVAIRTAERRIKDAIDADIIVKNAVGLYYSSFNNSDLNTVENETFPF